MDDEGIEIEVFEDQAPITSTYFLGLIDRAGSRRNKARIQHRRYQAL
jgi:UPF0288 family protein (methanogenesis marker protein 3)